MNKFYDDFELWCRECVTITDKLTGQPIAFELNAPQRRVLGIMEEQRKAGRPIRLIMLKARQWGGSTLVLAYMAWIQLVRRTGWNSLICAHVKDASANIRGMYSRILRQYPEHLKEGNVKDWTFSPYEKSVNISHIPARECIVTLATAQSPDGVRGGNYSMAHLSEVAFWGDDDWKSAEKIVRSVSGSVALEPETMVVMESTANGEGNFFHGEWLRAVAGQSDKTPVFVPWHEIEIYSRHVGESEKERLVATFDDYERDLYLNHGVSIEYMAWYHDKRKEYTSHYQMMAEYPSTPEEAFASSGHKIFSDEELQLPAADSVDDGHYVSKPRLVTLFPADGFSADNSHTISLLTTDDDKIVIQQIIKSNESLSRILRRIKSITASSSSRLLIVESDLHSAGSSAWLLNEATERGIPLAVDSNEESVVHLSESVITEMLICFRDIIERRRLIVRDSAVMPQLKAARYQKNGIIYSPDRATLLSCLTAVKELSCQLRRAPLNVADFL